MDRLCTFKILLVSRRNLLSANFYRWRLRFEGILDSHKLFILLCSTAPILLLSLSLAVRLWSAQESAFFSKVCQANHSMLWRILVQILIRSDVLPSQHIPVLRTRFNLSRSNCNIFMIFLLAPLSHLSHTIFISQEKLSLFSVVSHLNLPIILYSFRANVLCMNSIIAKRLNSVISQKFLKIHLSCDERICC